MSETVIKLEKVTSHLFQMKRLYPVSAAIIKNQIINSNFEKCTVKIVKRVFYHIFLHITILYVTYCRDFIVKLKIVTTFIP